MEDKGKQPETQNVDVEDVLKKYDKESNFRIMDNNWAKFIAIYAICFSLFHLYTAAFGAFPAQIQRAVHLAFAFPLVFLLYPARAKWSKSKMHFADVIVAVLSFGGMMYHVVFYRDLIERTGIPSSMDIMVGAFVLILVLEATRRIVGAGLLVVTLGFLAYAYWGGNIPGYFGHPGFSLERIISHLFLTTEGIIGIPVGVSATFLFLFVLFGSFLHASGLGKVFIDLALSIAGHSRGGPAKVAVLASCGFGSLSGSSVANTVTTGSFTIPLMKSIGYRPQFAGAVEAAASTGGQIMPPIMGAAAFLMAEFTGISYVTICIGAFIPALLYFFGVGAMVHFEAGRLDLKGIPRDQLPQFRKIVLKSGHLLIPLAAIIYLLVAGYTPVRAAFAAIVITVLMAAVKKETRISFPGFCNALEQGARNALQVAVACACAGIIIGVVTLTGMGLKVGGAIVALSAGKLFFTMIWTMIASIILGMGLPTTPKYIILATMAVPALVAFDVPLLAAHLFVLYFGVLADVTPPVGLAAFAGAGIAGSNSMKTGLTATKLTIGAFIVPFIFVTNPQMLLVIGDPTVMGVITTVISSLIGITVLAAAAIGYLNCKLHILERVLLFGSALALLDPGLLTDAIGLAVLAICILLGRARNKKASLTGENAA